jgi:hypothetical protein
MRIVRAAVKLLAPLAAICQQMIMTKNAEEKIAQKEARLAEALRANLRRRKMPRLSDKETTQEKPLAGQ